MSKFILGVAFLLACSLNAQEEDVQKIRFTVDLECPYSLELQSFVNQVTIEQPETEDYQVWKENFIASMNELFQFLESEKVTHAGLSWHVDVKIPDSP